MFDLTFLLSALGKDWRPVGAEQILLEHVCVDSRQARAGSLFVALAGERTDGHLYVPQALAAGARVVLVQQPIAGVAELDLVAGTCPPSVAAPVAVRVPDTLAALQALARSYRHAHPALRVVGVTGSVGKTTAKEAIAGVLAQRYATLRSQGNANNEIGLPLTLLALEPGQQVAVLEMAMYALGEIALLCAVAAPQVGVVMNVGPTHLERLGSIDRIAQAKAELVQALPADGLAVLNGDDARVFAMQSLSAPPAITFGLGAGNDVRASDIEPQGLSGVAFRVHVAAHPAMGSLAAEHALHTPMLGPHAVWPALAAVAVGLAHGLDWDEIARGLASLGPGLRLVPRAGLHGALLLDDSYNASPSSSAAALDVLAALSGRRVAVLGDMLELGDYESLAHDEVGALVAHTADVLVTVGERARRIAAVARAQGLSTVHTLADNEAAIALLRELIAAGDVVLIKGSRGMAMEQIVQALEER